MRLPREKAPFDRTEIVAGNILGATVIFLLLQVIVMVVFMVFALLLPGLGIVSPALGGQLGIAAGLILEAIIVIRLVRMVRRNVGPAPPKPPVALADAVLEPPDFERRLERLMIVAALLGMGCSLLMGLGSAGARVALTVIEAFTGIFLLVAIATRWVLTRRISTVALIALGAIVISFGLATGLIRR